jgi:hypothetical protein
MVLANGHFRVFFLFHLGLHALPIDVNNVGRRHGVPRLLRHLICVVRGQLVTSITSSLCALHWPLYTCMPYPLCVRLRHPITPFVIWKQGLRAHVCFVHECFVLRFSLLVSAGY